MTRCYIGLGANLGNAQSVLLTAAGQLEDIAAAGTFRLSPLYRSAPVEASGPDYVNAVAEFDTALDAHTLLATLQRIEQAHGRERPYQNAPRTLDLDLLLYGNLHIEDSHLTVPHPRMHQRAFVLRPLADLAPGLRLAQGTLPDLIAACAEQAIARITDDTGH